MDATEREVYEIFQSSGALLKGHFLLRSGRHSGYYFQCARIGENLEKITHLAQLLLDKITSLSYDTILAPAMGGLIIGQELARQAKKRYLFVEKEKGKLVLRRGFTIAKNERVLIVEDVVTRGGRVEETLEIIDEAGGTAVGVAMLVDRSEGNVSFSVPHWSLLALHFPTYSEETVPKELASLPAVKLGSL